MLADLLAEPGVEEIMDLRGVAGVLALHGGLEYRTAGIAAKTARLADASHYAVVQPEDLAWHVPSTSFDPRRSDSLTQFLGKIKVAVSFHGFGRKGLEGVVLLGGRNRRLAAGIADALRHRTDLIAIDDLDLIPQGLRGTHPANPVNLPEGGGVQVEMSQEARRDAPAQATIRAVAQVLIAEQRSLCITDVCQ